MMVHDLYNSQGESRIIGVQIVLFDLFKHMQLVTRTERS